MQLIHFPIVKGICVYYVVHEEFDLKIIINYCNNFVGVVMQSYKMNQGVSSFLVQHIMFYFAENSHQQSTLWFHRYEQFSAAENIKIPKEFDLPIFSTCLILFDSITCYQMLSKFHPLSLVVEIK